MDGDGSDISSAQQVSQKWGLIGQNCSVKRPSVIPIAVTTKQESALERLFLIIRSSYTMMHLTIIPFLIAGRVFEHETTIWRNTSVPECTFLVGFKFSMLPEDLRITQPNLEWELVVEMKCRPQGPQARTLLCQMGKRHSSKGPIDEEDDIEEPFEINFTQHGVENILLGKNIRNWQYLAIRAIVAQLNVGFDTTKCPLPSAETFGTKDRAIARCETIEKTRDGNCATKVDFDIQQKRISIRDYVLLKKRKDEVLLKFEPMPHLKPFFHVEMRKTRNSSTCENEPSFLFIKEKKEQAEFTVKSWTSKMIISEQAEGFSFESYTETQGKLTFLRRRIPFSIYESVHVQLLSVEPATEDLRPTDATVMDIFGGGNVGNNVV